ncbi:HNH endonuclease signature motif containing protein [Caldovatus aquaticus]|uniref:HNH endonuclease n=1 Tax=Caldovatus aquaticus TaxID=2865671 RepID=A0ABS7F6Z1_9PROT|nr:HNH endonuclease signature motif containing protein [Caldovatus aquaticus]MBW8271380.1 HNH endonuclease [Caldovatus aquaticus]
MVTRLRRDWQQEFRTRLLELYGGCCAVTRCPVAEVLEACHIDRYAERPSHAHDNGPVLRADLHRLFDAGLALLEERKGRLVFRVHPDLEDRTYRNLDGRPVHEPSEDRPDRARVRRHAAEARRRGAWPQRL